MLLSLKDILKTVPLALRFMGMIHEHRACTKTVAIAWIEKDKQSPQNILQDLSQKYLNEPEFPNSTHILHVYLFTQNLNNSL